MKANSIAATVAIALLLCVPNCAISQTQSGHVDLHEVGWHVAGSEPGAQPLLYNALGFGSDDSLWVLYPREEEKELIPKGSEPSHEAALAHLSAHGDIILVCPVTLSDWFHAQIFVPRSGLPIVQSGSLLQSIGGNCAIKAAVSLNKDHPFRTSLSTDGDMLNVVTTEKVIIGIDTSTLQIVYRHTLPASVRAGEVSVAETIAAFSLPGTSHGACESQDVVRRRLSDSTDASWAKLECSEFVAFSDQLLLAKKRLGHEEMLSLLDERGLTVASISTESGWYIDTPSFYLRRLSTSASRRVAEALFNKEPQTSLIEIFDLSEKKAIMGIHVSDPPHIFSFSLSSSGRLLGIMSGPMVDIYSVP